MEDEEKSEKQKDSMDDIESVGEVESVGDDVESTGQVESLGDDIESTGQVDPIEDDVEPVDSSTVAIDMDDSVSSDDSDLDSDDSDYEPIVNDPVVVDDEKPKKRSVARMFLSCFCPLGGLSIALIIHLVLGGYLMIYFEHDLELEEKARKEQKVQLLVDSKEYIATYLADLHYNPTSRDEIDNCTSLTASPFYTPHYKYAKACRVTDYGDPFCACVNAVKERFAEESASNLEKLVHYVAEIADEHGYEGENKADFTFTWTLPNSIFFCLNALALIGYGNISPRTWGGKVMFLAYAIVGLPIMMLFLASIGGFMSDSLKYFWSRIACRCCRVKRRAAEWEGKTGEPENVSADLVGKEEYMPTDDIGIPVVVTIVIMGLFVFIGGYVFSTWEGWGIIASIYFAFITLTTIGLGDFVPGSSFQGDELTTMQAIKMLVTTLYCLLGLAIISMGIDLAMDEITRKSTAIAFDLGLKETEEERRRYLKKRSQGVKETPIEKNGNKKTFFSFGKNKDKNKNKEEDKAKLYEIEDEIIE